MYKCLNISKSVPKTEFEEQDIIKTTVCLSSLSLIFLSVFNLMKKNNYHGFNDISFTTVQRRKH